MDTFRLVNKRRVVILPVGLALLAVFSGVMEVVGRASLDKRKELEQSREFLKNNPKVTEIFGAIKDIRYSRQGSKIHKSGISLDGIYAFKVTGVKRESDVLVRWENANPPSGYIPIAVILPGRFADDTVLWTSKERSSFK